MFICIFDERSSASDPRSAADSVSPSGVPRNLISSLVTASPAYPTRARRRAVSRPAVEGHANCSGWYSCSAAEVVRMDLFHTPKLKLSLIMPDLVGS